MSGQQYPADIAWEGETARIHRGHGLPYMKVLADYRAYHPEVVSVTVEEVDMLVEVGADGVTSWAEIEGEDLHPRHHFTVASRAE